MVEDKDIKKFEKDALERCTLCGLCKSNCPVYSVEKSEVDSPRGKMMLLKENKLDLIYYRCTLCGACSIDCPSDIDVGDEIRKARERLVKKKVTTPQVTKMIKNIKRYGNPFGEL